jgi:hypothetical protein
VKVNLLKYEKERYGEEGEYIYEFGATLFDESCTFERGTASRHIDIQSFNEIQKITMEMLRTIYRSNPVFVRDVLHLHFFKTAMYFDNRMHGFANLKISGPLNIMLFMVDYATSYKSENDLFKFELKINSLGRPSRIPFPILFNTLTKVCHSSSDIKNMYSRMYESQEPILVRLAEQFRQREIDFKRLSSELFEFVKRKECDKKRIWKLNELAADSWNYKLLALNNAVYETAIDIKYLLEIFKEEKKELDAIDEGGLYGDGYPNYLISVDNLIHKKLN